MINSIKFKQDYRCFKKDDEFIFNSGINLIVGDQGTGKSSLLECFVEGRKRFDDIIIVKADPVPYFYLDFEKDNPRTRSWVKSNYDIISRMNSHGQSNFAIIENLLNDKIREPSLIIVDEADMALSVRSCYKLVKIFRQLQEQRHQILAVVHNPIVISGFDLVLSLEHKKWLSSEEFLKSQEIIDD
jgi:predicted ATPase